MAQAMPASCTSSELSPSSNRHDSPLSAAERATLAEGTFLSRLPAPLVDAILARARVWRLADGEPLLQVGQPVEHWIGIAGGSALVFMPVPHLDEPQCTNWVPPGVWLNLYNPVALGVSDLDVRAQGATVVAAVDAQDLQTLCQRFPELSRELVVANAGNLRRTLQVMIASQRATLRQKQLFWLVETLQGCSTGQDATEATLRLSHSALARWHGVSRQAWREGRKALERDGLIRRTADGAITADVAQLQAALEEGNRAANVEQPYATGTAPWPPVPQDSEAPGRPALLALRTAEQERVRCNRWFASLPLEVQQEILEHSLVRRFSPGETVLQAHQAPSGAWLVVDGCVRLDNPVTPPPLRTIALLPPGAWYAFHDMAYRGPASFDGAALGHTTLLWLPPEAFDRLFDQSVDFRLALARLLALQQSHAARCAALYFWPVDTRVLLWLDMMHRYFGLESGPGPEVAGAFTLEDVAQWLGTTRQVVSRELRLLEQQGVIRRTRQRLELLQPARLPRLTMA